MKSKYIIHGVAFLFFSAFLPLYAAADQAFYMIRISCIPEANYFDIDSKIYHSLVSSDETAVKQTKRNGSQSKILAKHGIYFPRNLSYECKLASGTYKVIGSQPMPSPRGQCGASPTPSISIWRDNVLWIENVLFGEDCFGNPTANRIEIADGNMALYINISDNTLFDPILFQYLMPGEIYDIIPIKQMSLQKLVDSNYAYKQYKIEQKKK
jgi:hypothetical protein